jgi:hypothetical protein
MIFQQLPKCTSQTWNLLCFPQVVTFGDLVCTSEMAKSSTRAPKSSDTASLCAMVGSFAPSWLLSFRSGSICNAERMIYHASWARDWHCRRAAFSSKRMRRCSRSGSLYSMVRGWNLEQQKRLEVSDDSKQPTLTHSSTWRKKGDGEMEKEMIGTRLNLQFVCHDLLRNC